MALVTEEMREKGYRLCRDFLGECWNTIGLEDFQIERMKYVVSVSLLYVYIYIVRELILSMGPCVDTLGEGGAH